MNQVPTPLDPLPTLAENRRAFLAFVESRVGSRGDAEEILQAAFLRGVEASAQIRDEESVVAWFYRVLRNAVIDHHRRRGAEGRALEELAAELPFAAIEAPPDVKNNVCRCVEAAVRTLPPEQEELLRRVDLDDISIRDVARAEGIAAGSARVRLHRARQALRERVQETCGACAVHGCVDCTCNHADRESR